MPDYDPKSIPILDDVIEADILEQADAEDKHKAPIADITDMEDELSVDDGTINIFSTAPVELRPEDAIIEDSASDTSLINDMDAGDAGPCIGALDSLGDPLDDSSNYSPADAVDDTSSVNTDEEDTSSHHDRTDIENSETQHFAEEPFESALIDYNKDTDIAEETSDQPIPMLQPEARRAADDQQTDTEEVADSLIEQPTAPVVTQTTQATRALALDDIVDGVVNDIISQLIPELQQQLRYLVQQALEDRLPAEIISQDKPFTDQDDT